MTTLETLWWLGFWTAVGLSVGSFLNAVIYRLPRLNSLRNPRWSACPYCGHRIRWYDNLPIMSFVLLQGRCRRCGLPIATRYLVVEACMAVVVLMLFDAFFIGQVRPGMRGFSLTEDLAHDWPIFLAHIILFACLLPMSAIDLEHYWVDIRFTNFAAVMGFILHTLWTPKHSLDWIRPADTTAIVSLMVLVGLFLVWLVTICRPHPIAEEESETAIAPGESADSPAELQRDRFRLQLPYAFQPSSRAFGWCAVLVLVGLGAELFLDETEAVALKHAPRGLIPLLLFFVLIVHQSTVVRDSDHEVIAAIEEERFSARQNALKELALLTPAIVLGFLGYALMNRSDALPLRLAQGLHGSGQDWGLTFFRHWQPLFGFATAASGYIIGGVLGWTVRIVFTLIFGKEALGLGDIHLMAAAGCIAGWPVVVIGFFLTCGLALLGWLLALPFKRTRALPLGPWLSLSFLAVVVFYQPIVESRLIRNLINGTEILMGRD